MYERVRVHEWLKEYESKYVKFELHYIPTYACYSHMNDSGSHVTLITDALKDWNWVPAQTMTKDYNKSLVIVDAAPGAVAMALSTAALSNLAVSI